ncbi:hypothetical protein HDU76_007495, partial [Blyttiomyces sp. JEL0837]
ILRSSARITSSILSLSLSISSASGSRSVESGEENSVNAGGNEVEDGDDVRRESVVSRRTTGRERHHHRKRNAGPYEVDEGVSKDLGVTKGLAEVYFAVVVSGDGPVTLSRRLRAMKTSTA